MTKQTETETPREQTKSDAELALAVLDYEADNPAAIKRVYVISEYITQLERERDELEGIAKGLWLDQGGKCGCLECARCDYQEYLAKRKEQNERRN